MQRQNLHKIVLKLISKFGGQNPVRGRFLTAIENGKPTNELIVKFLSRAPSTKDIKIKSGLDRLRKILDSIFPKASKILSRDSAEVSTNKELSAGYYDVLIKAFDSGQTPKELQYMNLEIEFRSLKCMTVSRIRGNFKQLFISILSNTGIAKCRCKQTTSKRF